MGSKLSLPIERLAAQNFSDVGFWQRVDELNNLWRLVGSHLLAAMCDHILDCQRGIRSALARVLESQGRAMGLSDRNDIDFPARWPLSTSARCPKGQYRTDAVMWCLFSSLKLFFAGLTTREAFDDYPLLDRICGGNVRRAGQSVLPRSR
jgi:hypothetical protein